MSGGFFHQSERYAYLVSYRGCKEILLHTAFAFGIGRPSGIGHAYSRTIWSGPHIMDLIHVFTLCGRGHLFDFWDDGVFKLHHEIAYFLEYFYDGDYGWRLVYAVCDRATNTGTRLGPNARTGSINGKGPSIKNEA